MVKGLTAYLLVEECFELVLIEARDFFESLIPQEFPSFGVYSGSSTQQVASKSSSGFLQIRILGSGNDFCGPKILLDDCTYNGRS